MSLIERVEYFCDMCGEGVASRDVTTLLIEVDAKPRRVDTCDACTEPLLILWSRGKDLKNNRISPTMFNISEAMVELRDGRQFALDDRTTWQLNHTAPRAGLTVVAEDESASA